MLDAWITLPPWFFVFFFFLLGAILGSFVNAAIYRLPRGISLLTQTRSFCPQCNAQIAWHDNIPLLSFLLLRGKCRACRKPIPWRYLHVELCVALLFALAAWQFFVLNRPIPTVGLSRMPWIILAAQLFLIADLICATCIDLETWYIPDHTTLPWMFAGLVLAPFFPELHLSRSEWFTEPTGMIEGWNHPARWNALIDSFQGLVLGAGILWTVGFACVVLIGKEGMGGGDARLVGMLGALLGWKPALATFLLGIFLGCFIGIASLLWDRMQVARLGEHWKPRQPTYEIPEEEALQGPEPNWQFLVMGFFVLGFEAALGVGSMQAGAFWHDPKHIHALLGACIGGFLVLAFPVRRNMVAAGRWPQGEMRQREDGKKEEVLHGNYIPFGPPLALAGLLVAFYDPLIRAFIWWWFFERYTLWGAYVPFTTYLTADPLPFKVPGL